MIWVPFYVASKVESYAEAVHRIAFHQQTVFDLVNRIRGNRYTFMCAILTVAARWKLGELGVSQLGPRMYDLIAREEFGMMRKIGMCNVSRWGRL